MGMSKVLLMASFINKMLTSLGYFVFFFSSRRRHTRFDCDWSSDVCSSDLAGRDAGPCAAASRFEAKQDCTVVPPKRGPRMLGGRHVACGERARHRAVGYDRRAIPTRREDGERTSPPNAVRTRLRNPRAAAALVVRGTPRWHRFRYFPPPE